MKALLFGSIGVIVDSSSLQLEAYNRAFEECGLDWRWEPDVYESMLTTSGGRRRMREYAEREGGEAPSDETIARVHERKTELFGEMLEEGRARARPGVRRLVDAARDGNVKLGFVTGTEPGNVAATLAAAGLERSDFDVVTDRTGVDAGKPDPAPFRQALERLSLEPGDAVAIEDTEICLASASGAGIVTVATPNLYAGTQDFSAAVSVVDHLGDEERAARTLGGRDIVRGGLVTIDSLASLLESEELSEVS